MAPTNNDDVLELGDGPAGVNDEMADQATQAHEQNMAALSQSGVVAQNHFIGFTKLADYDYLEGHRLIGQTEAVGVREVSSKEVPAGPNVPGHGS